MQRRSWVSTELLSTDREHEPWHEGCGWSLEEISYPYEMKGWGSLTSCTQAATWGKSVASTLFFLEKRKPNKIKRVEQNRLTWLRSLFPIDGNQKLERGRKEWRQGKKGLGKKERREKIGIEIGIEWGGKEERERKRDWLNINRACTKITSFRHRE